MSALVHKKPAPVVLSAFFNIMISWHVNDEDQRVLLGKPTETTFYKWKNGEVSNLSYDTLERISHILGIYKALTILFPTREQANEWPLKPNKTFNHKSALEVMLKGSVSHISDVRRYLDAQLG